MFTRRNLLKAILASPAALLLGVPAGSQKLTDLQSKMPSTTEAEIDEALAQIERIWSATYWATTTTATTTGDAQFIYMDDYPRVHTA